MTGGAYAILVLHQIEGPQMQFIQQRPDEVWLYMLKASLQNSAAVCMSCELVYVILECRDEERPVREWAF
jgi:hypothetical protein